MSRVEALPVDEFLAEMEALVTRYQRLENLVHRAIGDGTLSHELVKRLCKEFYYMGRSYTAEFATMVSSSFDADELLPEASPHYRHWLRHLADQTGLLGDASHQVMRIEWARAMGISDEELMGYVPMPETIGAVRTTLYYVRRSYEEGVAAVAFAGERIAREGLYAKTLYEGLRDHYGIEAGDLAVYAYAEADAAPRHEDLLGDLAVTAHAQRRIRRAVLEVSVVRGARIHAMNRWLDEPGALRGGATR